MNINSIGSNYGMSQMGGMNGMGGQGGMGGAGGMRRPDAGKMAEDLFSKLDTTGQGYLDKASLQSALDSASSTSSTSSSSSSTSSTSSDSVDELFSALDSDGDGKVSKDEFTSGVKQLAEQLDSQFHQMRMQGMGGAQSQGMAGGMPPPPPGGKGGAGGQDQGLTEDQMTSMLSEISSKEGSNSKIASQLSEVLADFSAADADGDGKVTFQETMAFTESKSSSGSTASSSAVSQSSASSDSGSSSSSSSDVNSKVLQQMTKLMQAYGGGGHHHGHGQENSSSFSVAA